ncbi:MAG: hypothetical protein L0271_15880 [Gemmatimonadetes bacterium]|nr:hypothetical protein [Gemmatimonadota bacterium]
MPLPTERQLLDLWERGLAAGPAARTAALFSLASQDGSEEPDDLVLGERERRLLRLRVLLFGSRMAALAACPSCGEQHDIEFDIDSLFAAFPHDPPAPVTITTGDWRVHARPLTAGDVRRATHAGDEESAVAQLIAGCVIEARRGEEPVAAEDLPAEVRTALGDSLSAADPFADLSVDVTCGACGTGWKAALDAAAWVWIELHAWAKRLLLDVHGLASAYGWTEDDVLRLSPWRRSAYLSLAGR